MTAAGMDIPHGTDIIQCVMPWMPDNVVFDGASSDSGKREKELGSQAIELAPVAYRNVWCAAKAEGGNT